jgi:hypothetical protein
MQEQLPDRTISGAGRSRRSFVKMATGAIMAGAALASLPLSEARAKAALSDIVEKDKFKPGASYISGVFSTTQQFSAISVFWEIYTGDITRLEFQVRTSLDGKTFTDWLDSSYDSDDKSNGSGSRRAYGKPALSSGSYVQYRINIPTDVNIALVGLSFIDATGAPPVYGMLPPDPETPDQPRIISRVQWGANENLRYENGVEVWPRQYQKPRVLIVHHSETTNTYNGDPAVDVRSIYYFHAITRGWGDIGYNFLIDWKGNIYEGRYGGNNVIGGHASEYNPGSVGVCLIGSFKTVKPTDAQLRALYSLLAWKAGTNSINPTARVWHYNKTVNTICGHRDVMSTTCPGQVAWDLLPTVRNEVARILNSNPDPTSYAVELVSLRFSPTTLSGGQTLRIDATIKNIGTKAIETQGPDPGYTYEEGQDYTTQNFPKITNKFRLTIDAGATDNKPNPYRWGFGKSLQPGETVAVYGFIKLNTRNVQEYYGGVIQEYVKYHAENAGRQPVSVMNPGYPTARATRRDSDPNIRYFNETGHNLGYGFRTFWEKNGGLPVFGFPLTDEFQEVSPTDNKVYTVQYFERNRFEYHPENKGTKFEVLMGLLGVQLTQERNFPKVPAFQSTPEKWFFPETSHSLGGSFLKYWLNNGGLEIFGFPISEEFQEKNPDDGKTYTVQYFERNRFEYHPEFTGTKFEVLLGLLGKDVLRRRGWLQPGL